MKKCLRCTKQASLHITELKGGKSLSLHLCEKCAKDYLSTVEPGGPAEEFATVQKVISENGDDEEPVDPGTKACPYCGITFKQFRSQGRLGCPRDYEIFQAELLPLLENIHGETQHVGKFPPKIPESSRHKHELTKLRSELRAAVDDEQYEQAARLRDQIHQLEQDVSGD